MEDHPEVSGTPESTDEIELEVDVAPPRGGAVEPPVDRHRRRFLGLVAGGAALLVGGGAAWRLVSNDGTTTTVADSPATTRPSPTPAATTETRPPLPIPARPPDNPYAPTPQVVLGTLAIPRIGLSAELQEGITLTAINRGPGHWPGSAMPGELGNVVVAGHRTTYSHPFRRLNELQPGDPVTFTTASGAFTYQVRGIVIVDGQAIDIAAQAYARTATLFACHPPGSAAQRIVAKLQLLGPDGRPVDPDGVLPALDAGTQADDHTLLMKNTDPLAGAGG